MLTLVILLWTTTLRQNGSIFHEGNWLQGKPIPVAGKDEESPSVSECMSWRGAPTPSVISGLTR